MKKGQKAAEPEENNDAFIGFSRDSVHRLLPVEEKGKLDIPHRSLALDILYCIEENDVTIVVGETGSGKSTKIP